MIDMLHSSVLHGVLCALGPADIVRLASCSKSLNRSIMISACRATLVPILRERLKEACWSLLQAGYCVQVSNTLASYISSANSMITFNYTDQMLQECDYFIMNAPETTMYRFQALLRKIVVNDTKTFGEVFDRYIIHANARLQRARQGNRPAIRAKKIEKHFARCAAQLSGVVNTVCSCSICRPQP